MRAGQNRSGTPGAAFMGPLERFLRDPLAVLDGVVPRNPCDGIKPLPADSKTEIHPATAEQIVRIADAIDPRYRAAVIFDGIGSGLRAGELWALKVDRVNFLRRTVHVVESLSETNSGHLDTKLPKNGKPRHVRLDPATVEVLARHVEEYPPPPATCSAHRTAVRSVTATSCANPIAVVEARGLGPEGSLRSATCPRDSGSTIYATRTLRCSSLAGGGPSRSRAGSATDQSGRRTTSTGTCSPVTTMSSSLTSPESSRTLFQWVRYSTPSRVRLDRRGRTSPGSPMPHPHREPSKTDTSRHGERNRETRVGLPNDGEPSNRDRQTS
jgi:hypothetical protein